MGRCSRKQDHLEVRLNIRARIFAWGGAAESRITWKLGLISGHASLHGEVQQKASHLEVRLSIRARIFAWGGAQQNAGSPGS